MTIAAHSANEITVHLRISGFPCAPSTITEILGIQPSQTWRQGEALTYTDTLHHKDNGWEITSSRSDSTHLESHVADILRVVLPVRDKFWHLPPGSAVMLACGIRVSHGSAMPSIVFDAETLRFLGEINADIDVDLYCVEASGSDSTT